MRCLQSIDACSETEAPSDQRSVDTVIDVTAGRRLLSLVYWSLISVLSESVECRSLAL